MSSGDESVEIAKTALGKTLAGAASGGLQNSQGELFRFYYQARRVTDGLYNIFHSFDVIYLRLYGYSQSQPLPWQRGLR